MRNSCTKSGILEHKPHFCMTFLRFLGKRLFFIVFTLCFFASLGSFSKNIERTVSTGFGSITYTITGVDGEPEFLNSQGRKLVSEKSTERYMHYDSRVGKKVIMEIQRCWYSFNSYCIYQTEKNISCSVKASFNPAGSNSVKSNKTKWYNNTVDLGTLTQYDLLYDWCDRQRAPNVMGSQLRLTTPPYQIDEGMAMTTVWDKNGCWIRIGARYVHQYYDGENIREDIEIYYDEYHIMLPRPGSNPVVEDDEVLPPVVIDTAGSEPTPPIGPIHEEIDPPAPSDPGENGWIIGSLIGAIALGGGLAAWNLRKKKKEEKEKATPPPVPVKQDTKKQEQEDEDEYNERCSYVMSIKKDFGDTFVPGDPPQTVYARIIKITPEGREMTEPTLTRMIRISGDDYLQVSPTTPYGEYVAANVLAPAIENTPLEAVVNFVMAAEGASFTNHMHFFVEGAEILFGQDNLTLPAGYEKTVELPFVVLGLGEDPKVVASVEKGAYDVEVKKKDGLWFAVITENKECPDFKNKLEPGQYGYYSLHIKASDAKGREVETDYPLCRFQMGLTLDVKYIKCFEEEYDLKNHLSKRFIYERNKDVSPWNSNEPKYEVKKMTPAETKTKLRLFEYDETTHQVLRIPAVPDEIKFEAVEESKNPLVEKLGIDWEPRKDLDDGARPIIFRCIRGALDAPLRFKAKLTVKASFNGRKYETEKEVMLHSQPVRQSKDMADGMGQLKEDERITEKLMSIQSAIFTRGYLKNLAPLDRYIQTMLDSYDDAYGYDNEQLRTVRRIWGGFLQGTVPGCNAETEPVTLGDELLMFFNAFMAKGKEVEDSLGFFSRMALGVITLGCSEVVFTSMEVVREMKDYMEKGGDSVFGAFCCGVKVVAREYIMEKATDLGMGLLKKGATKVGLTPENLKAKAKEYYGNITQGRQIKQGISDTKAAKANAKMKADQTKAFTDGKRFDYDEIKMKKAEIEGLEIGKEKIENYRAAIEMLDDSPKNLELKKKLALEIQQDKNAMSLLADYDNKSLIDTRKKFSEMTQGMSNKADLEVRRKIAQDYGVPVEDIKTLNASSSTADALKEGKKITYDHDATFYYQDPDTGDVWYFNQKQTEELYNREYFKQANGFEAADQSIANRFAKKTDQTVIQSDWHPESYGNENYKILTDTDWDAGAKKLADANRVGDAMTYKCNEWYQQGMKELANPETAASGISKIREGCRQCVKQYENFLLPRNITRLHANGGLFGGGNKIPEKFHTCMQILKGMDPNKGGSVVKAKRELERLGTSFEKVFQQLGDLMREVG